MRRVRQGFRATAKGTNMFDLISAFTVLADVKFGFVNVRMVVFTLCFGNDRFYPNFVAECQRERLISSLSATVLDNVRV